MAFGYAFFVRMYPASKAHNCQAPEATLGSSLCVCFLSAVFRKRLDPGFDGDATGFKKCPEKPIAVKGDRGIVPSTPNSYGLPSGCLLMRDPDPLKRNGKARRS